DLHGSAWRRRRTDLASSEPVQTMAATRSGTPTLSRLAVSCSSWPPRSRRAIATGTWPLRRLGAVAQSWLSCTLKVGVVHTSRSVSGLGEGAGAPLGRRAADDADAA